MGQTQHSNPRHWGLPASESADADATRFGAAEEVEAEALAPTLDAPPLIVAALGAGLLEGLGVEDVGCWLSWAWACM